MAQRFPHWIDGTPREAASGAWLPVHEPASGRVYAEVAAGNTVDVESAIRAAQAAGVPTISGAEVFALQAAGQFRRYTGVELTMEQIERAAAAHHRRPQRGGAAAGAASG